MNNLSVLPLLFVASFVMTWAMIRYAVARQLIDVPNERSSHSTPTPRGGGVSVVAIVLIALMHLFSKGQLPIREFVGFTGAGLVVAVLGFVDDHGHVASGWRLLGHFGAATWGVLWVGGLPELTMGSFQISLGIWGDVLAVIYVVWLLNLFNFMDGIDGIAAIETITVCLCAALFSFTSIIPQGLVWIAWYIIAASLGFLFWNFPKARIFMGDACSGFLGLTLGLLSLAFAKAQPSLLWTWLILLGVFIADATITLLRRLLRGEKVYQAHRSHAYQRAAHKFQSHTKVSIFVGLINMLWLFPIGWALVTNSISIPVAVAVAYLPLIALVLVFGGGLGPTDR